MIDKLIQLFKHKKEPPKKHKFMVVPLSVQMNMKKPINKTEVKGFIKFVEKCMDGEK